MSIQFLGEIGKNGLTFPKNEHKNPKHNNTKKIEHNKGNVNTCNAIRCCQGGTSEMKGADFHAMCDKLVL